LINRLDLDELLRPFIGLIIEKGRLEALAGITAAVEALTDEHLGRVRAQATSAAPLSEAQRDAVRSALERRVGRAVVLETKVDPKLLAGLQVQLGSELMDGSVRGRLERLGRQLQSTH
jgi:F-type H+-transporting ATPase subunit delta